RSQDVAIRGEDFVRRKYTSAEFTRDGSGARFVNVGDEKFHTFNSIHRVSFALQDACEQMTDASDSLNGDANFPFYSSEAEARAHSLPHADRGVLADIAQFGRRFLRNVARCGGDGGQICVGDADITRAKVTARKTFDQAAKPDKRFFAAYVVIQHHNSFRPAAGESCERGFVGHAARKAKSVG